MRKKKLTKKNAEVLTEQLVNNLQDSLSTLCGKYGIDRRDIEGYMWIEIYSKDVIPFITSTAIDFIKEVVTESQIAGIQYGVDMCSVLINETMRRLPCISILAEIK